MAEPTQSPRVREHDAPAPVAGGIAARARASAGAPYLADLNPEQREAVETLDGAVLVLAGAGTGKTRVLTTRIAHILATGRAWPSEILAVTFTNKAAREMKLRVGAMVGGVVEGMPWMGTFHSIGVKVLRRHAELVGLKPDFTILDVDDQIRLMKQLLAAEDIDEKRWPARVLAGLIDGWKNRGLTPDQVPSGEGASFANGKGKKLYKSYQERLKVLNAADFGDLLIENIRLFRENPEVLRQYQLRFKYILVDEYQDTNVAQYLWLRLLAQRASASPSVPGPILRDADLRSAPQDEDQSAATTNLDPHPEEARSAVSKGEATDRQRTPTQGNQHHVARTDQGAAARQGTGEGAADHAGQDPGGEPAAEGAGESAADRSLAGAGAADPAGPEPGGESADPARHDRVADLRRREASGPGLMVRDASLRDAPHHEEQSAARTGLDPHPEEARSAVAKGEAAAAPGPQKNICCVGDDDQSIYGWRGAEVDNILRFDHDFPGAKIIRLERNYRSTGHILAAASHLIAHNEGRLGKTLRTEDVPGEKVNVTGAWDSEEEARGIGEEIEQLQREKHSLDEIAILVRASFQMREFEDRFVTLGLPYRVIGGPRFYERMEIRDALAYLRAVHSSADDLAFERIVNVPKRGLGDATIQVLHDHARKRRIPLFEAARAVIETDELKSRPRGTLRTLIENFDRWRAAKDVMPHNELAEMVLDESGYTEMWQKDRSADAAGRLENLKELIRSMQEFENLSGFLEHISLVMDTDKSENEEAVSVMTLHSAKGLEFDTVFLPGWEEGLFPHQRALDDQGRAGLEEERRLAHVGLTRARRRAKIYFSTNRRMHGTWSSNIPSRFLDELPEEHVEVTESKGGFGGYGAGAYGASRFDEMTAFGSSNYGTPGWQRAQQRRGFGRSGGAFEETGDDFENGDAKARGSSFAPGGSERRGFSSPPPGGGRSAGAAGRVGVRPPLTIEGELVAKSTGTVSDFSVGDRVFHQKFGNGNVVMVDGNKLTIAFDKAGEKRVVDSYVERV
jgi:superfamily I DNA/RNA helicase